MIRSQDLLNTSNPVTALSTTNISPEVVSQAEQKKFQQLSNTLSRELSRGDQLRAQQERAEFMVAESKYREKQNLGRLIGGLASGLGQVFDSMFSVHEARKDLNLKQKEDVHVVNSSVNAQKRHLNYVQQNPRARAIEVNEVLNEATEEAVNNAPSEAAKIDTYKNLTSLRMKAVSNTLDKEVEQDKQEILAQAGNTVQSLEEQAHQDPDNADVYLDQVKSLEAPVQNLVNDDEVSGTFLKQAQSGVMSSAIKGEIKRSNTVKAAGIITSPAGNAVLTNDDFVNVSLTTASAHKEQSKKEIKALESLNFLKDVQGGIVEATPKKRKNAANVVYDELLSTFTNEDGTPREGLTAEDVQQATVSVYSKYTQLPLAPKHRAKLEGAVRHGKPDIAAANARSVVALANNPDTADRADSLDKETLAESFKINRLMQFGYNAEEAVDMTRKELRVLDPNIRTVRKEIVKDAIKDNDIDEYIADDILGEAAGYEVVVPEARELFKSLILKHSDVDVAKDILKTRVQARYQISRINGRKEVMANSPEKFYPKHFIPAFKKNLADYTDEITKSLGSKPNKRGAFGKNRFGLGIIKGNGVSLLSKNHKPTIRYKGIDGIERTVNVGVRPIPNVTERGTIQSRQYMLINTDTNTPLLKSDLIEGEIGHPLIMDFDLTQTDEYKGAMNESTERRDLWKTVRDDINKRTIEIQEGIRSSGEARGLDQSQLNDIDNEFETYED